MTLHEPQQCHDIIRLVTPAAAEVPTFQLNLLPFRFKGKLYVDIILFFSLLCILVSEMNSTNS
jgi:hypothetical protein